MNGKIIFTLMIPFLLGLLMACNQAGESGSTADSTNETEQEDSTNNDAAAITEQPSSTFTKLLSQFSTLDQLPVKITSSFEHESAAEVLKGTEIETSLTKELFSSFYSTAEIAAEVPIRAVYKIPLSDTKMGLIVRLIPDADYNSVFYLVMADTKSETIGQSMLLADLELSGGSDAAETVTEITRLANKNGYQLAVRYSSSELVDGEREEDEEVTGYTVDANGITKIEE